MTHVLDRKTHVLLDALAEAIAVTCKESSGCKMKGDLGSTVNVFISGWTDNRIHPCSRRILQGTAVPGKDIRCRYIRGSANPREHGGDEKGQPSGARSKLSLRAFLLHSRRRVPGVVRRRAQKKRQCEIESQPRLPVSVLTLHEVSGLVR